MTAVTAATMYAATNIEETVMANKISETRQIANKTGYASWAGEPECEQYEALCEWVATHGMDTLRRVDPVAWDRYHADAAFRADVASAARQ